MAAYTIITTFEANNVDVALAVASEMANSIQDAIDCGELEGVHLFSVDAPMCTVKPAPEGVAPFPPEQT